MSAPGITDTNEDGIGLRSSVGGARQHFFNNKKITDRAAPCGSMARRSLIENNFPTLIRVGDTKKLKKYLAVCIYMDVFLYVDWENEEV